MTHGLNASMNLSCQMICFFFCLLVYISIASIITYFSTIYMYRYTSNYRQYSFTNTINIYVSTNTKLKKKSQNCLISSSEHPFFRVNVFKPGLIPNWGSWPATKVHWWQKGKEPTSVSNRCLYIHSNIIHKQKH